MVARLFTFYTFVKVMTSCNLLFARWKSAYFLKTRKFSLGENIVANFIRSISNIILYRQEDVYKRQEYTSTPRDTLMFIIFMKTE